MSADHLLDMIDQIDHRSTIEGVKGQEAEAAVQVGITDETFRIQDIIDDESYLN